MQINIVQWEQSNALTLQEQAIIDQIENLQQKASLEKDKPTNFKFYKKHDKKNDDFFRLEIIQGQYQQKLSSLQSITKNLEIICDQLKKLNDDKDKIVQKISQFHQEANIHINKQKELLEYQFQIQENIQYYYNIQKISRDLESDDRKEINYQVLISEIQEGIIFFSSKPNYYQSDKCIIQYQQLKKRLLGTCKSSLMKLLNKESQFINQKFSQLKDLVCVFYPPRFFGYSEFNEEENDILQPNPLKLQFLQIIFPQLIPQLKLKDVQQKNNYQYEDEFLKFSITEQMKDLFLYIESQIQGDQDLYSLYNDVFLQYNFYNRLNLHQQINELINKQSNNLNQTGQILYKINQSLIQQKLVSKQHLQKQQEILLFEALCGIIFETTVIEAFYSRIFFRLNLRIVKENDKQHLSRILDNYYQTVRMFLQKIYNLDQLVMISESLQQLKNHTAKVFQKIKENSLDEKDYLFPIFQIISQGKDQSQIVECFQNYLNIFTNLFLEKINLDIIHKSIQSSQVQIQQKIYQYSPKDYIRQKQKLTIHKFLKTQPIPKGYEIQRSDLYPAVIFGLDLITKMQRSVDQVIFRQLAGETLREINSQLKLVAEQFDVKFDSYIFYLKNIIYLCDGLAQQGGDYIVKESELDFSETKAVLLQLITGQLRPEIQWVELTSPEKLWTYITNFFQFVYKGMPKINQYEVDWKNNLMNQKNLMLFQFVKDMTFIVAKTLIQYIRNYQYLQHKLVEEKDEQKLGQAEKDFNLLISQSQIKRSYSLFYENIIDFIQEINLKLNNYLEKSTFDQIQIYITEIIQNSLSLLSQFYIIVSKHYGGEEYENFQFNSSEEIIKYIKIEYFD
ncbi:unnamed protein product (macronuclear) [Paramecium tetraurelia]|uniref:Conserved oligomeric Golgi complex subunit 3 n=1 Tax=Paramecium tetraurelia TaxID=5888 RepID=A0DVH4_PARTE|nr:uncharacterized protein GSPATT00020694001 [Paramecium tetraurelia]CAK87041.1 unnamed protein product [Paramecium tetraurelia]|eukprot:XP_001454438.1 hypothetical protein (macronuclear) [Paramecium tetraurelia strain d4-2]